MAYLPIPRAEHDFMYVSIESDTLLTFWFLKTEGAITSFAYLVGDGVINKKCSRICVRSDGMVGLHHYGEEKDELEWKEVGIQKVGELGEFVEAYELWKQEIESILLGD